MKRIVLSFLVALGFVLSVVPQASAQTDPLPSWNDGAAKKSIVEFVAKVTEKGGRRVSSEVSFSVLVTQPSVPDTRHSGVCERLFKGCWPCELQP